MEIKYLQSFICLYAEQNLHKAGEKLYISSQGLSRQIQTMEKELGTKLFIRTPSGMKPTAFSDTIYPVANSICAEYAKLESLASRHLSQSKNVVTICIPIGFADVIQMQLIYNLRRSFPDFEIVVQEFESDDCRDNLLSEKADIAFLTSMTSLTGLEAREFREEGSSIIVSRDHPLALRGEPVYVQDLYDQKLYRRIYRKTAGDFFRLRSDQNRYDAAQIMAVGYDDERLLVVTKEGACVLDVRSTMHDVTHPDLVVLDIADITGWIYCCTKKDVKLSAAAKKVLEYILESAE